MSTPKAGEIFNGNPYYAEDTNPRLAIEHVSYGVRIHALRTVAGGKGYLRVNNYLYPNGTTPASSEPPPVGGYQGRWYVPIDDVTHARFEFIYRRNEPVDRDALRKAKAQHIGPDQRHVRRADNRYLQDREELKRDDTFAGMGRYLPAQDAFAIETQGAIQDRTLEHLGSTDIVIIEMRKALLAAIKRMDEGNEPPGLLRDPTRNQFPDFICISDFVSDGEDGPAYCRRVLGAAPKRAARAAAE
jgi:hypothetical protein